jgi:hypothetical protein
MAVTFEEFCERLGTLRLDRGGGLVKPYKPLLVAAVVILIHKGKQPTRNVFLDGGLRSAFQQLLCLLYPRWPTEAKPEYPFRHLENDGVWKLAPIEGASSALRAAKDARAEAWDVLRHVRCAQLDGAVYERLAARFEDRFRVLRLLTRRYFPTETSARLWDFLGEDTCRRSPSRAPPMATRSRSEPSRSTSRRTGTRRRLLAAEWSSLDARSTAGLAGRSSPP